MAYYGPLDIRAKSINKMFYINDRQKINRIRDENGGNEMVKWMQYSDETGEKIPTETLRWLLRCGLGPENIRYHAGKYLSTTQLMNYIRRQQKEQYPGFTEEAVLEQYNDYLSMCKACNKNMKDELTYRPRELKRRHDEIVIDKQQMDILKEMMASQKEREQYAQEICVNGMTEKRRNNKMKRRKITGLIACIVLIVCLTGCAELDSALNDLQGNLTGNTYTINTYDNYGNKIMTTQGEKINIEGNAVKSTSYDSDGSVITGYELSSVITINIDGKEIQSCGDTCIFEQNGLNAEVNFTQEDIQSQLSGAITDNTIIAGIVNKYKNSFGKSRVVVIKSQLGQPITAYSGDKVYWKIPQDLPKMTKLMIDGKALYIHRANFQIIDKELLK